LNSNDELISETLSGNGQELLLSLASSSLDSGFNHIRIRVEKESCINRTLDKELDINNIAPFPLNAPDSIQTCLGSNATVSVASGENISSYVWFSASQEKIEGQTSSTFTTQPISETTIFFVSAQHTSGCSTPKEKIVITPLLMDEPVITVTDGEMIVEAEGSVQWSFEGQPIEGATSNAYAVTKSGNYTVKVSQGDCEKISAPYLYVLTSVGEIDSEFKLHAYPSPATAREFGIRIQAPTTSLVLIQVVDMTGRVLFKKWFDPGDLASKLNLMPELKNGLYSVIASQDEIEIRKRIVIRN
jgi:hypothetical protein